MNVRSTLGVLKVNDQAAPIEGIYARKRKAQTEPNWASANGSNTPHEEKLNRMPTADRSKLANWVLLPGEKDQRISEEGRSLIRRADAGPLRMARSYTLGGINNTFGYCDEHVCMPPAGCNGFDMTTPLEDRPLAPVQEMIATHLLWKKYGRDELISFTRSSTFSMAHLQRRLALGQTQGYVAFLDRRDARTPSGQPVRFLSANQMCKAFDIFNHPRLSKKDKEMIKEKYYSQEFLVHGEVNVSGKYRHVSDEELMKAGAVLLFPQIILDEEEEEVERLYTAQLCFRHAHDTEHTITSAEAIVAISCAQLAHHAPDEGARRKIKPWLPILTWALSGKGRGQNNQHIANLVEDWGYTPDDLNDCLYRGYEQIPSNLPEIVAEYNVVRNIRNVLASRHPNVPEMLEVCITNLEFRESDKELMETATMTRKMDAKKRAKKQKIKGIQKSVSENGDVQSSQAVEKKMTEADQTSLGGKGKGTVRKTRKEAKDYPDDWKDLIIDGYNYGVQFGNVGIDYVTDDWP